MKDDDQNNELNESNELGEENNESNESNEESTEGTEAEGTTEHSDYKPVSRFDAAADIDTYVSFEDLGHGYIWVNGVNLGRYDSAGPQMTLYLPGHILKEKDNEIIVLDIDPVGARDSIEFIGHEILEGDAAELR